MLVSAMAWTAGHGRRIVPAIIERLVPIAMAAVIALILIFSEVPPNLLIVDGHWAELILAIYGATMIGLVAQPSLYQLHRIALVLGVGAWMGRGGGFLELVVDLGRWDLIAAVAERALIVVLLVFFHVTEVTRHGIGGTLK